MPQQIQDLPAEIQFLRVTTLCKLAGVESPSTLYRWIQRGTFPELEKIGNGTSGLRLSTYQEWAENPSSWGK